MARGNSTEDERQEVAEGLLGLPPKELSIALEKLHSDYDINEWNDIYSKFMEINPQSQVRYNNPEELELSKMSEEDLLNSIDGIDREQTDLTDAEKPIVKKWIKEELEKRKSKSSTPSNDKLDHEIVNDFALDAIKDNFTPPGAKGEIEKDDNIGKRFKTKLGKSYSIKKEIDPDTYGIHWEDDNSPRGEAILDRMEKNLHNDSLRTGYISELKDEIDTNDNGEIEVDEMADFQKSLDDYASKNKKGREDIPATYKR